MTKTIASDHLELANVSSILAIIHGDDTYIIATGKVKGSGGTLKIVKSLMTIYPTRFAIYTLPGHCDDASAECSENTVTVATHFKGKYQEIIISTAEHASIIHPIEVREEELAYPGRDKGEKGGKEVNIPGAIVSLEEKMKLPDFIIDPDDEFWLQFGKINLPIARAYLINDQVHKNCYILNVYLRLIMPTPGFKISLKEPKNPSKDPHVFLLDYYSTPPPGDFHAQVMTPTDTTFTKSGLKYKPERVYIPQLRKTIVVNYLL